MTQLRVYTTTKEYFITRTVKHYIQLFNSFKAIKLLDYNKTITMLAKSQSKCLELQYNSELNLFKKTLSN